ncbi:hypothetical protein [Serratia proteamaculans]|uniref:hypothetical protein n=1 Tax=Serratia proteamaculans TaxID=28151 RepID=UPI0021BD5D3D|nr:hypothetical protein [Serratia proteamaculans]
MNKLSELSKPVAYDYQVAGACIADSHNKNGQWVHWRNELSLECPPDWMIEEGQVKDLKPRYSQEYVSALLERISELEWRELNSAELKELLTWHPTEKSAATDPILFAAMRNKINLTRIRVAGDEAKKEQSNG